MKKACLYLFFMITVFSFASISSALNCETDCMKYPPLCKNLDSCIKECKISPFQAQNCYQDNYITKAQCLALYSSCQDADPKCAPCKSYPGLCKVIDMCISQCNLAPIQKQNCAAINH